MSIGVIITKHCYEGCTASYGKILDWNVSLASVNTGYSSNGRAISKRDVKPKNTTRYKLKRPTMSVGL